MPAPTSYEIENCLAKLVNLATKTDHTISIGKHAKARKRGQLEIIDRAIYILSNETVTAEVVKSLLDELAHKSNDIVTLRQNIIQTRSMSDDSSLTDATLKYLTIRYNTVNRVYAIIDESLNNQEGL